jgi:hypothetical protein
MASRPSRRGLFWIAAVLLLMVAGLDLARRQTSYLRSFWSSLHSTPQESTRSLLEQFRARRGR